jgi:hypothetical protein
LSKIRAYVTHFQPFVRLTKAAGERGAHFRASHLNSVRGRRGFFPARLSQKNHRTTFRQIVTASSQLEQAQVTSS